MCAACSGDQGETPMLIRSAIATAVFATITVGCTPPQSQNRPVVNDKTYPVTPGALTVKGSLLRGALTEMKVVERVEDGTGRIDTPARLTGKLVLTNVSKDQSLRLRGGKLLYIDMQGKPIPLDDKRTEPTRKVSNSSRRHQRLD